MLSVNPTKYYLEKNFKKNPNMMPITWELGNSDAGKLGFLPLFERFSIVSLTEEGKVLTCDTYFSYFLICH